MTGEVSQIGLGVLIALIVVVYAGLLALLYAKQRGIVFRPDITRADLAAAGLAEQMTEIEIKAADGLTLHSWWAPA